MTKIRRMYFLSSLIALLFGVLLFSGISTAATLHAIIVADTLNQVNPGQEPSNIHADKDVKNLTAMFKVVAQATGLKLNLIVLDGQVIVPKGEGRKMVLATIEGLRPNSDDVVVFHYSGHGVMDYKGGQWPAMELQGLGTPSEGLLQLSKVKDALEKQNPRLLLVMADTCNEYDMTKRGRGEIIKLEPGTENAYKALFLKHQGIVIASGSERGQSSKGDTDGGFFTQGFLDSLQKEVRSPSAPKWENIMTNTQKWVKEKNSAQTSQAEVRVAQINLGGNITDNTNGNMVENVGENTIGNSETETEGETVGTEETLPVNERKITVDGFDSGSVQLKSSHISRLKEWYGASGQKSLGSSNPTDIEIEGHADSQGSDDSNLVLSERRATTVKKYLVGQLKADPTYLRVISRGESLPIASNNTESGRALNRRVKVVSKSGGSKRTAKPASAAKSLPIPAAPAIQTAGATATTANTVACATPLVVSPQSSSSMGSCFWKMNTEDGKKWSLFIEDKLWFNTWTGWYREPGNPGHFIAATTDPQLTHLVTIGGHYRDVSLMFSFTPKRSYDFPDFSVGTGKPIGSFANRQEMDVTLGYSLMPELMVGLSFKKIIMDYESGTPGDKSTYTKQPGYDVHGPALVAGSQVCLANWVGSNIFLFGNFSYGFLKTKWSENNSDLTRYHSADVGVSFELPKFSKLNSEIRLGYRTQTIYTEVSKGDGMDTTEGFTLGLRITF
jgi:outer membrane protein OmpA-like peptidoglycan-associated protein